ncbi:MAG: carboxypeptidase regulatory-like domain-containing protein [Planctomycetes bacterium]|nr:carboxypeptidase regulatory-like domain-containing protein [Planctomycetota bacterium]
MRSAVVVLLFVVVAAVAGWFYFRSQADRPTGAAAPTASALPIEKSAAAPALAGPESVAAEERAAVKGGSTAMVVPKGAAAPVSKVGVTGRVVDGAGNGIGGARVLAAPSHDFSRGPIDVEGGFFGEPIKPWATTTAADGRFELKDVSPGTLRLAIRASGYACFDKADVPVPAAAAHDLGEFALELGVRLSGRVVDSLGRGVAGAKLLRTAEQTGAFIISVGRPAGVPLATTDANGGFVVDMLAAGPYRLLTTSDDHPDQITTGATAMPGERVDGLEIALAEGLEISGRVVGLPASFAGELAVQAWPSAAADDAPPDALAGAPNSDAPHRELRKSSVAADGTFRVRGARKGGSYDLSVIREKQIDGWWGDSLTARKEVEAGARGVELAYQPEAALVFQVVDRATRQPIEEFDVSAGSDWPMPLNDENDRIKRHHPDGRVRFGRLRPRESGPVMLKIEAIGYEVYTRDDIVLAGGEELQLGVIELAPAPVLSVRVVDAATQQPVAGARVELGAEQAEEGDHRFAVRITNDGGGDQVEFGDTKVGRTDENGVARVGAITSDRCRLRVTHSDFAPYKSELFELTAGQSAERIVSLSLGGTVHAKLVGSDGQPQPGARVEHRALDQADAPNPMEAGLGGGVVTDADGVAHFTHLAPGVHGFRAKVAGDSGGAFAAGGMQMMVFGGEEEAGEPWIEASVTDGGEADVTVVAPQLSRVHGRITEAGEPLSGATVQLEKKSANDAPRMPFGPSGPSARTAADGSYELESVRAGAYTVVVTHASRVMPNESELVVSDVDERLDVELPLAILAGRVVDAQQKPVVGAEAWPERATADAAPQRRGVMRAMLVTNNGGGSTTLSSGDEQPRTRTDADGRYELRGVTADTELVVNCRASGFQPGKSEPVRVATGQTTRGVDLALATAGGVELTVVGAAPEGERYFLVRASWVGEPGGPSDRNEMTDDKGLLKLDGLKPGPWKLSVRSIGGFGPGQARPTPTEQQIEVLDGKLSPLTIQMP